MFRNRGGGGVGEEEEWDDCFLSGIDYSSGYCLI